MHQGRRFNIQTSRACTAPDKLAGHILIFHYLLRCHPTGRHPRCHFGAFTAHLGCRCCPGEQPGQPRRFLGGDDCQPVISCTAPSVFRENHGLLGEPSIPSGIAGYRAGTSPEEQRKPERRVTAPIWPRARRGLVPTAAQCLRQRSPRPRRRFWVMHSFKAKVISDSTYYIRVRMRTRRSSTPGAGSWSA